MANVAPHEAAALALWTTAGLDTILSVGILPRCRTDHPRHSVKHPPIPRAALALPLLALFASAACSSPTFEDRCASAAEIGRLHLRLLPEPGLFGYAQMIEVGDTLRFGALLQPEVGASTDLWGGGGCKIHYGDPVAATLEWRTSNAQIFTVDAEGLVTGRAAGEAVLTARAVSHGMEQSRELTIYTGYPFGSH